MLKRLFLCEKFLAAKDVAQVVGVVSENEWYFECADNVRVAWFDGHLLGLAEPEVYNKDWADRDIFPVIPKTFVFTPNGKRAEFHLRQLEKLVDWANEVVNACDAGREGELIFRLFWKFIEAPKKPILRLWFNDNTPGGIAKALASLEPGDGDKYLALGRAAQVRTIADWLVGINGSRAVSKLVGGRRWSVGRVQTAILFVIYQREKTIREFNSKAYFSLYPKFVGKDTYEAKLQVPEEFTKLGKFGHVFAVEQEALAVEYLAKMATFQKWMVSEERKYSHVFPFPLFDLQNLQRFCAVMLGWSSARTIEAAQEAYAVDKTISYPRTASSFLPEAFRTTMPNLYSKLWLQLVAEIPSFAAVDPPDVLLEAAGKPVCPFRDDKVGDHYAIIPTGIVPSGNGDSATLWRTVMRRFLLYFMPPACIESLHRLTQITFPLRSSFISHRAGDMYTLKAVTNVDSLTTSGWTMFAPLMGHPLPGSLPQERHFPAKEPEGVMLDKVEFYQGFTDPPSPFDEDTLLGYMDRFGLGTPATQAATLETLVSRGYITRQDGKPPKLKLTKDGQALITALLERKIPFVTSPELTGQWEEEFDKMESLDPSAKASDEFLKEVVATVQHLCRVCEDDGSPVLCPVSGKPVSETEKTFSFPGFPLPFPRVIAGREMSASEYRDILSSKRGVGPFSGFTSKVGKAFDAKLIYDANLGKVTFNF